MNFHRVKSTFSLSVVTVSQAYRDIFIFFLRIYSFYEIQHHFSIFSQKYQQYQRLLLNQTLSLECTFQRTQISINRSNRKRELFSKRPIERNNEQYIKIVCTQLISHSTGSLCPPMRDQYEWNIRPDVYHPPTNFNPASYEYSSLRALTMIIIIIIIIIIKSRWNKERGEK